MTSVNPKNELEFVENFHCQQDKPLKRDFFDDSEYFPKKIQEDKPLISKDKFNELRKAVNAKLYLPTEETLNSLSARIYEPETIAIPILELQNIIDALEAGLEHTQTVLTEHDASLGRTTRKNKSWAEHLEKDIEFLKARISMLKHKLVGVATHYP